MVRSLSPLPPISGVCGRALCALPSAQYEAGGDACPAPPPCVAARSQASGVRSDSAVLTRPGACTVEEAAADPGDLRCSRHSPDPASTVSPVLHASRQTRAALGLEIGALVYWISDGGAERAQVRWVGKLPLENGGRDWMVGVEFERAVGSGSGRYGGRQLFTARLNHASFVPTSGLIRAVDFDYNCVDTTPRRADNADCRHQRRQRQLEQHSSSEESLNFAGYEQSASDCVNTSCTTSGSQVGGLAFQPTHMSPSQERSAKTRQSSHNYSSDASWPVDYAVRTGSKFSHTPAFISSSSRLCSKFPILSFANNAPDLELLLPGHSTTSTKSYRHRSRERSAIVSPVRSTATRFYVPLSPLPTLATTSVLAVDTAVEVEACGVLHYGVIRWIGDVRTESSCQRFAGIETESEIDSGNDGCFRGKRHFTCPLNKALFVPLNKVRVDSRLSDMNKKSNLIASDIRCPGDDASGFDLPLIDGIVPPLSVSCREEIKRLCGKSKGIQGHLNSCYLDATLFSMFAYSSVLDCLLFRPRQSTDIPQYDQVQKILREEIVNPLRSVMFVRADKVMCLRQMLDSLSSVEGMTSEEKDPEEFVQSLLAQVLHARPFLRYSSGQESYLYQLIVEQDSRLTLPSVQQLFDQSFLDSSVRLAEIPACLIVQMPRFGNNYRVYPRILPSTTLDITDVLDGSPRQCCVCGGVADWECRQCFSAVATSTSLLAGIAFCHNCDHTAHCHPARAQHCRPRRRLHVPNQFHQTRRSTHVPRHRMQLFAVVCIATSHYVSFVRSPACAESGDPDGSGWVFFDSMADRCGEQHGYNIPEVRWLPDLSYWLEEGAGRLALADDSQVPDYVRRLLSDSYMCFYQSCEVMMYR